MQQKKRRKVTQEGQSPFDYISTELLQGIFIRLPEKSLLAASQVCQFWQINSEQIWLRYIKKLMGPNYKRDPEDNRSYKIIYYHCKIANSARELLATLIFQKSLFDESATTEELYTTIVSKQLNQIIQSIHAENEAINLNLVIKFLIEQIPQNPKIKCILERGHTSDDDDPEIVKYKDDISTTPCYNITQVLTVLNDGETIELLHSKGINTNISYYNVTPLMLAIWFNSENAFLAIQNTNARLYKQESINSNFKETLFEFVVSCHAYKILPILNITPKSFDKFLADRKKMYSSSVEFIKQLLIYFEDQLTEIYKKLYLDSVALIVTLNEAELKHPLSICFAHFAVNLEKTNNNAELAEKITQTELRPAEYKILQTVKYFFENNWLFPEWFHDMLEKLELDLTIDNQWQTTILEDEINDDCTELKI